MRGGRSCCGSEAISGYICGVVVEGEIEMRTRMRTEGADTNARARAEARASVAITTRAAGVRHDSRSRAAYV